MKPWVQSLAHHEPGMVAHLCSPSTQDVEAGQSRVQGPLWLYHKVEDNPVYTRYLLNKRKIEGMFSEGVDCLPASVSVSITDQPWEGILVSEHSLQTESQTTPRQPYVMERSKTHSSWLFTILLAWCWVLNVDSLR